MRESSISDNKSVRTEDENQSQQGLGESLYVPSQTQVIKQDEDSSNLSEEKEINLDSNKNSIINLSSNNKETSDTEKKDKNNEKVKKVSKSPGNIIYSYILEKKKNNILNLEIDLEKSFKEKTILYEISTGIENNISEKNILCCRRYNHFYLLYNLLQIRYPQYIFPKLTPKNYNILNKFDIGQWSATDIKTFSTIINQNDFLKKRRIELEFFINEINNHFYINKGEEIKKFLKEIKFDEQYFTSSVKSFYYPESEKKMNNNGIINKGVNLINFLLGRKNLDDRINSKKIKDREEKLINKLEKYKSTFNEIKKIFSCYQNENEEKKNISKNLSYLETENLNYENNLNKKNFHELIKTNKELNNKGNNDKNLAFFEEEIVNPLDFCVLNLKGEKKAIKRYVSFLDNYYKIMDYKEKDNKKIIEEQIKIKNDIDLYEETLIKEMKRIEDICS